jgi:hypothetical protein
MSFVPVAEINVGRNLHGHVTALWASVHFPLQTHTQMVEGEQGIFATNRWYVATIFRESRGSKDVHQKREQRH